MQYKNLGRSGLKVSQLSYGAWVSFGNQLDVKDAKSLLQLCRDSGVNFFDNAEVYANGRAEEIIMGGAADKTQGFRHARSAVFEGDGPKQPELPNTSGFVRCMVNARFGMLAVKTRIPSRTVATFASYALGTPRFNCVWIATGTTISIHSISSPQIYIGFSTRKEQAT